MKPKTLRSKLTRSAERYQDYLRSDSSLSFIDWLRVRKRNVEMIDVLPATSLPLGEWEKVLTAAKDAVV